MGWRIKYRQSDQKYRLWSTIADDWLTEWSTKREIQQYIAEEYLLEHKKRIIEMVLRFPHHWQQTDSARYLQDNAAHEAHVAWLHVLSEARDDEYYDIVERKYNEVMQALDEGS